MYWQTFQRTLLTHKLSIRPHKYWLSKVYVLVFHKNDIKYQIKYRCIDHFLIHTGIFKKYSVWGGLSLCVVFAICKIMCKLHEFRLTNPPTSICIHVQSTQFKGQVKNNEATQKYSMQGIYSAVMTNPCWYLIFGPFCNTFASLFLTWPLNLLTHPNLQFVHIE